MACGSAACRSRIAVSGWPAPWRWCACPGSARAGRRSTVGPEKISLLSGDEPAPPGAQVEAGRIRDVVYAGVLTRYIVDLDAGGELVVARQNAEAPTAAPASGTQVRLAWRADQAFTITQGRDG